MTFFPYSLVPVLGFFLFQALPSPLGGEWQSVGATGGLAALMFFFYRQDRARSEKLLDDMNAKLVAALSESSATSARLAAVIESHDRRLLESSLSHRGNTA